MEYLSVKGSVKIKDDVVIIHLLREIGFLIGITFDRDGHVHYQLDIETQLLELDIEGAISSETADAVIFHLLVLESMITFHSRIEIERIRWEVNALLSPSRVQKNNVVDLKTVTS